MQGIENTHPKSGLELKRQWQEITLWYKRKHKKKKYYQSPDIQKARTEVKFVSLSIAFADSAFSFLWGRSFWFKPLIATEF